MPSVFAHARWVLARLRRAKDFSLLKNTLSKLISREDEPSRAPRGIGAKEQKRNILEVFHHLEARQEVHTMLREQVVIEQDEVWFAHTKELPSHPPVRGDENLVVSLLCKHLTKM